MTLLIIIFSFSIKTISLYLVRLFLYSSFLSLCLYYLSISWLYSLAFVFNSFVFLCLFLSLHFCLNTFLVFETSGNSFYIPCKRNVWNEEGLGLIKVVKKSIRKIWAIEIQCQRSKEKVKNRDFWLRLV